MKIIRKLRRIVTLINNFVVGIILSIFYFLAIGLSSVIYRLFKHQDKDQKSFWTDTKDENLDLKYFQSPY